MPLNNFALVSWPGPRAPLVRCAQPDAMGFRDLATLMVNRVVKLDGDGVAFSDEQEMARPYGIEVIHEPMPAVLRLDVREQAYRVLRRIEEFLDAGQGVCVHCRHGRNRTGFQMALWRAVSENWSIERAYAEWEAFDVGPLDKLTGIPDWNLLKRIVEERKAG